MADDSGLTAAEQRTLAWLEERFCDEVDVGDFVYEAGAEPRNVTQAHFGLLLRQLRLLRWLDRFRFDSLIDVGSGFAFMPWLFRERYKCETYYCDFVHRWNLPTDLWELHKVDHAITAKLPQLPFADGAFDLVTCRIAAHHFRRVDRFASECWRVLRPGGALALADNVSPDDPDAAVEADAIERFRDPSHVHCLSIGEWRQVLERAGFTIEHQERLDMPLELEGWARRMHVGDRDREELRRRILGASETLRASWRPQETGGDVRFVLTEVLLIARRG